MVAVTSGEIKEDWRLVQVTCSLGSTWMKKKTKLSVHLFQSWLSCPIGSTVPIATGLSVHVLVMMNADKCFKWQFWT